MDNTSILTNLKALVTNANENLTLGQIRAIEKVIKEKERAVKQEKETRFQIVLSTVITDEDIDDIMAIALEGGIDYWCDSAKVIGDPLGEYASDQISRGGELLLHDEEAGRKYLLTKAKLIQGLKFYLETPTASDIIEVKNHKAYIDTAWVDAEVADAIIQYAIFGEIVYG